MKKSVPFTFYLLYFAALASLMPFVVVYYQQLGFSGAQIGLLTSMGPLITLVALPFWTGLADASRRHKLIMSLAICAAVVSGVLFPLLGTFLPLVLLVAFYSIFSSPIASLSDSATMAMLGGEKAMYGRVRLGGTIGWAVAAPLAGMLVQNYGLQMAFWGYAAIMFLGLLVSTRYVFRQSTVSSAAQSISLKVGARRLLTDRRWLLFLCMSFICGAGLSTINNYFYPYMGELHASKTTMGLALTLSTLSELPLLFFSNRLIKRFGSYGLLVLGMAATSVRLLLYAVLGTPTLVLIFQVFNGLAFPMFWVAGVAYADEHAPAGMSATAQGLFGAITFGFGAAGGSFLGGLLMAWIGSRAMYLTFGLTLLFSLAVITLIERHLRAQPPPQTDSAQNPSAPPQ